MSTLAIIPARGGSKGIPRKNLALLCGKPLIGWTIESARQSHSVDRVAVSTDDPEIGYVADNLGAEVVWRPAKISGDAASSEDALLHCLEHFKTTQDYQPHTTVFLQCTSPLTLAEDIDGTIEALRGGRADTALAVVDFHYFLWKQTNGQLEGVNHEKSVRLLRQQREVDYLEAGAIYVMKTSGFLQHGNRFFGKTVPYHMPGERCWEIDDPIDLKIAQVMLRDQRKSQSAAEIPRPLAAVVCDFDGVFTDNRALVLQDGREAVSCDRGDGYAIDQLKQSGIEMLVLSSEKNPVVQARCNKLGISCLHGVDHKQPALSDWLAERRIDPLQVVYVGNDVNDLGCLQAVGCGVVVNDAHPDVIPAAQIVLSAPGGRGAIRELAGLILESCHG